jgi:hypothetical protein
MISSGAARQGVLELTLDTTPLGSATPVFEITEG